MALPPGSPIVCCSAAREKAREEMREAIRRDRMKHQRQHSGGVPVTADDSIGKSGPDFQVFAPPYPSKPVMMPTAPTPPRPSQQHTRDDDDADLSLLIPSYKQKSAGSAAGTHPQQSQQHRESFVEEYWKHQQSTTPVASAAVTPSHHRYQSSNASGTVFSGLLVSHWPPQWM